MARQRRHDEQARIAPVGLAVEMDDPAEGLQPDDLLHHIDGYAVDLRLGQIEAWLAIAAGEPLEQFGRGRDVATPDRMGEGVEGALEEVPGRLRHGAGWAHRKVRHLVKLVGNSVHAITGSRRGSANHAIVIAVAT